MERLSVDYDIRQMIDEEHFERIWEKMSVLNWTIEKRTDNAAIMVSPSGRVVTTYIWRS